MDKQPHEEHTFLVFESALVELFRRCTICFGQCTVKIKKITGSAVTIEQVLQIVY